MRYGLKDVKELTRCLRTVLAQDVRMGLLSGHFLTLT